VELQDERVVLVRHLLPGAAQEALRLLSMAEAGGVPVQRRVALRHVFTFRPFGWWHAFQFESGQTWHQAPPNVVATRRLAIGLARLHSLPPTPGIFIRRRSGALERAVISRSTAAIQSSAKLSSDERSALLRFVTQEFDRLAPAEGYRLVHGDLHGLNIIVAPPGQIFFIDMESVGGGLPLLELAHVLLNLFGKRNANLKVFFLRNYLSRVSPTARVMWHQNGTALLMFARLVMAWRRHRRSVVLQRRGDRPGAAEAAHFHERFLADSLLHLHRLHRAAEKRQGLLAQKLQATTIKSPAPGV
jgi:aminoglycoside phosphotransferase (APT) family kinase protein